MKLRFAGPILAAALVAACDGPLDVSPRQSIPQEEALSTAEEIRAGAVAMYDALQTDGGYSRNLLVFPDMYADNLQFTGTFTTDREVWLRDVTPANAAVTGIWSGAYSAINRANNLLGALPSAPGDLPAAERTRLEGEARFVRALAYSNLARFFGGVPIILTPTRALGPEVNVRRNTLAEVWAQVEADLNAAIPLLPSTRIDGRAERANRWAARALLARAQLEQRKWQQAHDNAHAVITSGVYSLQGSYANVFHNEQTTEAILELRYTVNDANALAFWFYPSSLGGRRGFAPTAAFLAAFPAGDQRLALANGGGGTTYGRKYTEIATGADDVVVLRLAEMYLIRAEARARLGLLEPAIDDVNVLRARAGVPLLSAASMTQDQVLVAVLHERRLELFYEGHRFFDLRRFADVPAVSASLNALGLTGHRLLFPIPQRELDANPELAQNPGY
jgi:starch-binding outer membrane protein, SusD/RagB family